MKNNSRPKGVAVYRFLQGDVEDPDFYAKLHIGEWINTSDRGRWLHQHHRGLSYTLDHDGSMDYGWEVTVYARLGGRDLTWYLIRYPEPECAFRTA